MPSVVRYPLLIGVPMVSEVLGTHELIPGMLCHHKHVFEKDTLLLAYILTTSS